MSTLQESIDTLPERIATNEKGVERVSRNEDDIEDIEGGMGDVEQRLTNIRYAAYGIGILLSIILATIGYVHDIELIVMIFELFTSIG